MAQNIYTSDQVPDKQDYGGYASNQRIWIKHFLDMQSPFSLIPGSTNDPFDLKFTFLNHITFISILCILDFQISTSPIYAQLRKFAFSSPGVFCHCFHFSAPDYLRLFCTCWLFCPNPYSFCSW